MDLKVAKEILFADQCTCVLVKGEKVLRSHERGVKPMMQWLADGVELTGFSAADKVVGKATAFLYVSFGVRQVYAPVMSRGAIAVLDRYGIGHFCDETVDSILNRSKDGFCPMESAVRDLDELDEAMNAIRAKYQQMNS